MKLVVNYSMLGSNPTGLGVYAANCFDILGRFRTTVISSGPASPNATEILKSPSNIAIGSGKMAALRRQFWSRRLSFPDSLVYSPTHHGLPGQDGQVITIHDLISLRFPRQHYPQYLYFKYVVPRLLKQCSAVFVVSEATREDVARAYGYPKDKIFLVPNAVDTADFKPGMVDGERPYLLMVGARYPHKNVDEVLRFSDLWKDRYRLVVTSCGGKYREQLERQIRDAGILRSVEFLDYVDRADLVRLYQGCSALLYPSKWEGFGIPPLEALACGRPVIASDIPAHKEVLGDSAFLVELGNKSSWQGALRGLDQASLKADKAAAGLARVAFYTKDNAVDALERSLLAVAPSLERRG